MAISGTMGLEGEGELYDLPQFKGFFGRVKLVGVFLYALFISHQFVARMAAFWGYGMFIASTLTLTIPQTEIPMDKTWSPTNYNLTQGNITSDAIVETSSSYGADQPPNLIFDTETEGLNFFKLMPDSTYLPALAVGNVIGGILVDMFGSRRPIVLSLLTTGLACLMLGMLTTWYKLVHKATLITLFVLAGLFSGAILPAIIELCGVWLMIDIRNPRKWVGLNMCLVVMTNRLGAMLHGMLIYPWRRYSFELLYITAASLCIAMVPITYLGIISTPAKLRETCFEYPKAQRQALLKISTPRSRSPMTLLKSCIDPRLFVYGIPLFLIGIPRYNSLNYSADVFLWSILFAVFFFCILSDWIGRAACALFLLIPAMVFNIVLAVDQVLTAKQENIFDYCFHGCILCVQMILIACIPIDITFDCPERNTGTLAGLMFGMFTAGSAVGAAIGNAVDVDRTTTSNIEYGVSIGTVAVACMLLAIRLVPDYRYIKFWRSIDYLGRYMREQAALKAKSRRVKQQSQLSQGTSMSIAQNGKSNAALSVNSDDFEQTTKI